MYIHILCICMYIYIYTEVYINMYIYIYIYLYRHGHKHGRNSQLDSLKTLEGNCQVPKPNVKTSRGPPFWG